MAKSYANRIPRRIGEELRDDRSNYIDKELESEKRSTSYSTEKINKILEQMNRGEKVDMMPFFHGKVEWRNSDITFEYTQEEWEELQHIMEDPVYFVEKYCTFLTDKGRKTVKLRPYQKDVIHMICDEVYDEKLEILKPKNRRVLLLQSRQTGKCVNLIQNVSIFIDDYKMIMKSNSIKYKTVYDESYNHNDYINIPLYELYFYTIDTPTLLDKLTYKLFKNNAPMLIITILFKLKFGFKHSEKLIYSKKLNIRVKSPIDNTKTIQFHITKPFDAYNLHLENGCLLKCADEHLVYCKNDNIEYWKHVDDLLINKDFVLTEFGWSKVIVINKESSKEFMCDLTVDNTEHSYYTNSIVSHNTTTTSAACVHYLLTHTDKNVLIVANKGLTAEEVLGKVLDIMKGMPYFLKIGIKSLSKNSVVFENGCSMKCSATTTTAGVGSSISKLIVDEAALIPDSLMRPFYLSIFPTLSSSNSSQIVMMSTPRGNHGVFAETYLGSVAGTNGFVHKRVHWSEVEGRGEEWKQEQISAFGEAAFNQEFDLSFNSDASKLISPKDLDFATRIKKFYKPVEIYGIPWSVAQKIYWHPDFHPDQLTEQDLLTSRFFLKIDTAEGKMKGQKGQEDPDWNIINIFQIQFLSPARIRRNRLGYKQVTLKDCIRIRQIGIYMDQDHDEEHSAEAAKHLVFTLLRNGQSSSTGLEIDNVRISLEINFNGVNWIKEFAKHDFFYSSLILKTFHSQKATRKEFGFKTVSGARGKGYWCEEGAKLISRRQIIVSQDHQIANCSTIQQLQSFGKTKSGSYDGDGMHDDIATTVLFCSIDFDNEDFIQWIEDWFRLLPELGIDEMFMRQLIKIGELMDMYVEQTYNDGYTEDEITALYSNAVSGFNSSMGMQPMIQSQSVYGNQQMNNPYGNYNRYGNGQQNTYNPYQQSGMYQQRGGVMMPRQR